MTTTKKKRPGGHNYWLFRETSQLDDFCRPLDQMTPRRGQSPNTNTDPLDENSNPEDEFRGSGPFRHATQPAPQPTPRCLTDDEKDRAVRDAQRVAYAKPLYTPPVVDIVRLRKRLNMTQVQFARRLGLSVNTLRHWEYGDRKPGRAALVLLSLIERDVAAAMRLLRRRIGDQR
jgi:putative transcriptional regulator